MFGRHSRKNPLPVEGLTSSENPAPSSAAQQLVENVRSELLPAIEQIGAEIVKLRSTRSGTSGLLLPPKNDGTLLSEADLLSATGIHATFQSSSFKGDRVITEEDPEVRSGEVKFPPHGKVWVVDPLDNTRAYVAGGSDFSILLTRSEFGAADLTLVHYPELEDTYLAGRGVGAFKGISPVRVSKQSDLSSARIAEVYTAEVGLGNTDAYPDSTEAIVAVAEGSLDLALIRMCGHKVWDIAFSALLVSEAGGFVTDESGEVPVFNRLEAPFEWLVVSNRKLHSEGLSAVQRLGIQNSKMAGEG